MNEEYEELKGEKKNIWKYLRINQTNWWKREKQEQKQKQHSQQRKKGKKEKRKNIATPVDYMVSKNIHSDKKKEEKEETVQLNNIVHWQAAIIRKGEEEDEWNRIHEVNRKLGRRKENKTTAAAKSKHKEDPQRIPS